MYSYQQPCDSKYYLYDCEENMNNFTSNIIIEDNYILTLNMTYFTISNMIIGYFKFLLYYYPLIIITAFACIFLRILYYLVESKIQIILNTYEESINTITTHINDINEYISSNVNSMNNLQLELSRHNIFVNFDTPNNIDDLFMYNAQINDIKNSILTCFESMTIDQLKCNKDSILHIKNKFNAFYITKELRVYAFLHTMYNRFIKSINSHNEYETFVDYLIDDNKTRVTIDTKKAIKEMFYGNMYESSIQFFIDTVIM